MRLYSRNMTMLSGFTPNVLYMFSRAAGKNILALSIIVIILVLRNTITFLRNNGFGKYLPLDNNIYLHKIVGTLIFFLGMKQDLYVDKNRENWPLWLTRRQTNS